MVVTAEQDLEEEEEEWPPFWCCDLRTAATVAVTARENFGDWNVPFKEELTELVEVRDCRRENREPS